MRKTILFIVLNITLFSCNAQVKTENNKEKIKKAQTEIAPALEYFSSDCLVNKDCNDCVNDLVSKAENEYQNI